MRVLGLPGNPVSSLTCAILFLAPLVGAFLGTTAVGVYAVTLRLADYQRQLCNQVNGLLFPVVGRSASPLRRSSEAWKKRIACSARPC